MLIFTCIYAGSLYVLHYPVRNDRFKYHIIMFTVTYRFQPHILLINNPLYFEHCIYVTQRSVVVYRHVRENTHDLMKRKLSVMKMLLSVTHPPSSEALRADTATPSGSGVQASEHKSTQYFSSLSDSYKSSSWFLVNKHDMTKLIV